MGTDTEQDDAGPPASLGRLAKEWGSYPDLLEGLCRWFGCAVLRDDRHRRRIAAADVADLRAWLDIWRSRPKLSRPKKIKRRPPKGD